MIPAIGENSFPLCRFFGEASSFENSPSSDNLLPYHVDLASANVMLPSWTTKYLNRRMKQIGGGDGNKSIKAAGKPAGFSVPRG
jgi:hypothetical protein